MSTIDLQDIQGLIGPYETFCGGSAGEVDAYVCPITLHTGDIPNRPAGRINTNDLLDIHAFDLAEARDAYLGQINLVQVSSFCGPLGQVWGLDIVVHDKIADDSQRASLVTDRNFEDSGLKIYNGEPLIEAGVALLGKVDSRHFPPMPGAMVPCVSSLYFSKERNREQGTKRDCYVYCGLGVGIPAERDTDAVLFMQFTGGIEDDGMSPAEAKREVQHAIAKSIVDVGINQHIRYSEAWVCTRIHQVKPGHRAVAFSAIPYLTLARNAVPDGDISQLISLSLTEWTKRVQHGFLTEVGKSGAAGAELRRAAVGTR